MKAILLKTACIIALAMTGITTPSLVTAAGDEVKGGEKFDITWRYPIMAIPRLETDAVIDGKVDAEEWARATLFPALINQDALGNDGFPPEQVDEQSRAWMYYTDEAIFFAFRQLLPPSNQPPAGRNSFYLTVGPFQFFAYANNTHRQRRNDQTELGMRWAPAVEYQSREIPGGWEGEWKIPFSELDMESAPEPGTEMSAYLVTQNYTNGRTMFTWPYVRWRRPGESRIVFAGDNPGVRFERRDEIVLVPEARAGGAEIAVEVLGRGREPDGMAYYPEILSALDVSDVGGGTFRPFDEIIGEGIQGYHPKQETSAPGEYLMRYSVEKGDMVLARGVEPFMTPHPLEIAVRNFFLQAQKIEVIVSSAAPGVAAIRARLSGVNGPQTAALEHRRANFIFSSENLDPGKYELLIEGLDEDGNTLISETTFVERPEDPKWWTMDEGREPAVPAPWTPVALEGNAVSVLSRTYVFSPETGLPASIVNQGEEMLAAPIRLESKPAWRTEDFSISRQSDEEANVELTAQAEGLRLSQSSRVEFDGFILLEIQISGQGTLEELELAIPLKSEFAELTMNGWQLHGTGPEVADVPRGSVPEEGYSIPPQLVTWVGSDDQGIELNMESIEGWSLRSPGEGIQVLPQGGTTLLKANIITKPVEITPDSPRTIRIAVIPTPTRVMLDYVARARNDIDFTSQVIRLIEWTGTHAWHPLCEDEGKLASVRRNVEGEAARGRKLLFNGGWHISVDDEVNAPWVYEMFAMPLANRSFGKNKQYTGSYDSPYGEFFVNSFAHNARETGAQGIRFDTVTPWQGSNSELMGHGWRDDNGELWHSYDIFAQREIWKRLYRIFHGGVIPEGILWTPTGGSGPGVASVHSFTDYREVAEGFFQNAVDLKTGYPSDYARANMSGRPQGLKPSNNLKFGPLFYNERIAALLLHDADPRFFPVTLWSNGYEAQAMPSLAIWEAFEWVDRPSGRFVGFWEMEGQATLQNGTEDVYCSVLINPDKGRALAMVTNYAKELVKDAKVAFDFSKLGVPTDSKVEDAITGELIPVTDDGIVELSLYAQRYRILKIGHDVGAFDTDGGDNLLSGAPERITEGWISDPIKLDAAGLYVLKGKIKIEETMGVETKSPNVSERFGPRVRNFVAVGVSGDGLRDRTWMDSQHYPEGDKRVRSLNIWEETPGWISVHLPFEAVDPQSEATIRISKRGEGTFQIKDLQLVKLP